MANQLLLVNPSKRRKPKRRKKVMAKRRMKRDSKGRFLKRKRTVRKKNPIARRTRRKISKRRPAARLVTRRYKRNPVRVKGLIGQVTSTVIPAATAGVGALGLDLLFGIVPIPVNLKTGPFKHLVKGAGAIGLGMLSSMVVSKKTANLFTTGALTVIMHDAFREMTEKFAPQLKLGYSGSGIDTGVYDDEEMGMYLEQESIGPTSQLPSGETTVGEYLDSEVNGLNADEGELYL